MLLGLSRQCAFSCQHLLLHMNTDLALVGLCLFKGTVLPAEGCDFMSSQQYDNNVISYYLSCLETKTQVNLN